MPAKIMVPMMLVLAGIGWLAFSNFSKANYFFPVDEMPPAGSPIYNGELRVKGRVVPGTIENATKPVRFTIQENDVSLKVVYIGTEPLPDMFKDRAEAVVDGRLNADGVFEATQLQAKCASKYEAKAPDASEGTVTPDQTINKKSSGNYGY